MKIHIMTDMEGCAGVLEAPDYTRRDSRYYEYARELATLEVSAAVEGALEAGATEVLVADGHGPGAMRRDLLHPRARLLTGRPYPPAFTYLCDGTFAAGMIIGQHAKSNADGGHLAHTMGFGVEEYVLNGMCIGEIGLWMLTAGYFGVPIIMLSGDQAACDESKSLVPNIEVAPVKWGIARGSAKGLTAEENRGFNSSAVHMHPDEARALIRERSYRAMKRIPEFIPLRFDPPYKLAIALRRSERREKPVTLVTKSKDFLDLIVQEEKLIKSASLAKAKKAEKPAPPKVKPRTAPKRAGKRR